MEPATSVRKTTEILISVRDGREAAIASRYPIGILDLKDPDAGALGWASNENREDFLAVASEPTTKSVALGELVELSDDQIRSQVGWQWLRHFQYAKVGLAGATRSADWRLSWKQLRAAIPSDTVLVGVAYADWNHCQAPAIEEVFELVGVSETSPGDDHSRVLSQQPYTSPWASDPVVLLDTYSKSQGTLIDIIGWPGVAALIDEARSRRIKLVVAGSLQSQHLERLLRLAPDYVGLRGAVCDEGRSQLSEKKMAELFQVWGQLNRVFDSDAIPTPLQLRTRKLQEGKR